MQIINPEHFVL